MIALYGSLTGVPSFAAVLPWLILQERQRFCNWNIEILAPESKIEQNHIDITLNILLDEIACPITASVRDKIRIAIFHGSLRLILKVNYYAFKTHIAILGGCYN